MASRRIARIAIHFDMLIEMMHEGWDSRGIIKNVNGIPVDAEYVGSYFDPERLEAYLYFMHPSFDPIEYGQHVPVLYPPSFVHDDRPIYLLKELVAVSQCEEEQVDDAEEVLEAMFDVALRAKKWMDGE